MQRPSNVKTVICVSLKGAFQFRGSFRATGRATVSSPASCPKTEIQPSLNNSLTFLYQSDTHIYIYSGGFYCLGGYFMQAECTHLDQIQDVSPSADGCEDCLKTGDNWVHLRICLVCGHVGCCDNSKNKHATQHFHATGHPLIQSLEPGETWRWCYVDKAWI